MDGPDVSRLRTGYSVGGRKLLRNPVRRSRPFLPRPEGLETRALMAVTVTPIKAMEGVLFQGTVSQFSKDDVQMPDQATATLSWGDGTTSSPGVVSATDASKATYAVAATHTYSQPGLYSTIVTVKGAGVSMSAGQGTATVSVSPVTLTGTTVNPVLGQPFSGVVATFVDPDHPPNPADYQATIDFGDNQTAVGKVESRASGGYQVSGTHDYVILGSYEIKVSVTKIGAGPSPTTVTSLARVVGSAFNSTFIPLFGRLDPAFDTGVSNTDGVTSNPFPRFIGTSNPLSVIFLYGRRFDQKEPTLLARVVSDSTGQWVATPGPIPDGRYVITAMEANPGSADATAAVRSAVLYSDNSPLVIDTIGLSVVGVIYAAPPKAAGRTHPMKSPSFAYVTFLQDTSGIDINSLTNALNYQALRPQSPRSLPVPAIAADLVSSNTGQFVVRLTFANSLAYHGAIKIVGVHDIAGNAITGVFSLRGRPRLSSVVPYR